MRGQAGFSIIEVVIGAGLMSLVAMGFSASLKNGTIGQKSLQAQDDARVLTQNMQSLVSNPAACAHTFGGTNPVNGAGPEQGTSVAAIRDRNNVAKFQVTSPRTRYGNRGVQLEELLLGGVGNDRSGVPRWTSTSATTGIALVRVTWRQTGYKVDGVGAQDLLRFFLVNVTSLNASNQIVACTAEVLGTLSEAFGTGAAGYLPLWQTEASLTKSAVFQHAGSGNVGVGTENPAGKLAVASAQDALGFHLAGGFMYLQPSRSGPNQGLQVDTAGLPTGSNAIFVNAPAGWASNAIKANQSGAETFAINTNGGAWFGGNVGIGTPSPGTKLDVAGAARAHAYYYTSDRRLKTGIETIDGLALARKLRGVRFEWTASGEKDLGFIAQEVESVAPELVLTDAQGMKSVKYGNVAAILVEALKQQDRAIDDLRKQNEAILKRLEKLERK